MSDEIKIVQPSIVRRPVRLRGPFSSEEYNDFQDQVYSDILNLSSATNSNYSNLQRALINIESELQYLKRRTAATEESLDYKEYVLGRAGAKIDRFIDFHDTSGIIFPDNLSELKRAVFNGQFGEICLPSNAVENRFFNFSLRNGQIVIPSDFRVSVNNTFDKLDGNGFQDYEYGGTVDAGTPDHAFNGLNESAWIRTVTFPIDSDVEQVECELIAVVPAGVSAQANLVELNCFPEGSVDVIQVSTAPDLTASYVLLDNFVESYNAIATRYHFSPRDVEQIKIRLRCRNWREINGKKVFMYGIQEVGLQLVDYTKTVSDDQVFGDSITSIVKITSPRNHAFGSIYRIDPWPNFFLEDASSRHVRLRLSSTPDLNNVFWDSKINQLPQQLGSAGAVSTGASTDIYAIYTLKFVSNSGGYQSPYSVGTTPFIKGLGLTFTAIQSDNS